MHLLSAPLGRRQLLPKVLPLQMRQLAFHVAQALVQQVSCGRWHCRVGLGLQRLPTDPIISQGSCHHHSLFWLSNKMQASDGL